VRFSGWVDTAISTADSCDLPRRGRRLSGVQWTGRLTVEGAGRDTPIVALRRLSRGGRRAARAMRAKLEDRNPTGSIKDGRVRRSRRRTPRVLGSGADDPPSRRAATTGISLAMAACSRVTDDRVMPREQQPANAPAACALRRGRSFFSHGRGRLDTASHTRKCLRRRILRGDVVPVRQPRQHEATIWHGPMLADCPDHPLPSRMGTTGTLRGTDAICASRCPTAECGRRATLSEGV